MLEDPFTILGVNLDATDEEIRKAYRLWISMLHPDKFPINSSQEVEANRISAELNAAYEKIKTAEARQKFLASRNPSPPRQNEVRNPASYQSQSEYEDRVRQETRARKAERMRKQKEEKQFYRNWTEEESPWPVKHPWKRE
ncbi:MAG: J domain-containing protein [Chthoniobacterales bacterium]|nr:J domain-containing protein [Chthoniobacterales bacterium]